MKLVHSNTMAGYYFFTKCKLTVDRAQVENRLTFATVVALYLEDRMLNRYLSANFNFKTFLVLVSSGYYVMALNSTHIM